MNIGIQQLLVSLFLLVPGFIATGIQRSYYPKKYETDFQWVVSSLLFAIFLNALLLSIFLTIGFFETSVKLSDVSNRIKEVSLGISALYLLVLYSLAIIWGIVTGSYSHFGLRAFLNRFTKIPYAKNPSVWDRVFEVKRPEDRLITWLKFKRDGEILIGHLCHSSAHIEMDKAFEVFLDKIHVLIDGSWNPIIDTASGKKTDGIYLRLTPEMQVEFLFTNNEWSPSNAIKPDS